MTDITNYIKRPRFESGGPTDIWQMMGYTPEDTEVSEGALHVPRGTSNTHGAATQLIWDGLPAEGETVTLYLEQSSREASRSNHSAVIVALRGARFGGVPVDHTVEISEGITTLEMEMPEHSGELWLKMRASDGNAGTVVYLTGVRFSSGPADDLGVFDGDSELEGRYQSWLGPTERSPSVSSLEAAGPPEPVEVTAPPPEWKDEPAKRSYSWTTPSVEGVVYDPATGWAMPGETVTVTATALEEYVIVGDSEWTYTFSDHRPGDPDPEDPDPEDPDPEDPDPEDPDPEDPDPEDPDPEDPDPEDPDPEDPDPEDPDPEDPDPEDPVNPDPELAVRVLAYADMKPTERRLALAQNQVEIVTAYVYGYTRGHGFIDGQPKKPLESVIISATARLAVNPRQLQYYSAGDYSERPAVLAGWTLLERAVLDNYRVRWA